MGKNMYSDYSYLTTDSSSSMLDALAAGTIAGLVSTYIWIVLIILVLTIIAQWKLFEKAGEAGWKCLIPIYSTVVLFRIAGISPWWVLGYLAVIIPGIGGLITLGITIYAMIMLAKAFGKGAGFTVGLILLNTIFIMILGFGSSSYQLNRKPKMNVEIEE